MIILRKLAGNLTEGIQNFEWTTTWGNLNLTFIKLDLLDEVSCANLKTKFMRNLYKQSFSFTYLTILEAQLVKGGKDKWLAGDLLIEVSYATLETKFMYNCHSLNLILILISIKTGSDNIFGC